MKQPLNALFVLSAMALAPIAIGLTQTPASALSLQLNNINFVDGGTATGSFDYNTATNTISNWNIQTTIGSVLTSGFNYTGSTSTASAPPPTAFFNAINDRVFVFSGNARVLAMVLSNPVNNTPGASFQIKTLGEGNISNANIATLFSGGAIQFQGAGQGRLAESGGTVNGVPEPEDIMGLGVALGALFLLGKTYYKKKQIRPVSNI
ncbi:hypothetical protein H6G41_28090 [Tolypothrix sp. FACHB-123]|uniref:hypothetical protein n=1 Tax=Tolypothrix sp. FACHB-123 TaxID=2692868 RepID=UPI001683263A|nr:hypothetical protein [Tolypothrix sp. FACHB-123]MBD2358425.1 hypothetical protein [Tolypothrix sp. FACHB-123]